MLLGIAVRQVRAEIRATDSETLVTASVISSEPGANGHPGIAGAGDEPTVRARVRAAICAGGGRRVVPRTAVPSNAAFMLPMHVFFTLGHTERTRQRE